MVRQLLVLAFVLCVQTAATGQIKRVVKFDSIATKKDTTTSNIAKYNISQEIEPNSLWECTSVFLKGTFYRGKITGTSTRHHACVGQIFLFDSTQYTIYHKGNKDLLNRKFRRTEFNKLTELARRYKVAKRLRVLADGTIALINSSQNKLGPSQEDILILTKIPEPQHKLIYNNINRTEPPTLEEYFYDAEPIPDNIEEILSSTPCWHEQSEVCQVKDGVIRVVGNYPYYHKDNQCVRRFKKGLRGEYYSCLRKDFYSKITSNSGKFKLDPKDLLYIHNGSIIYINHEKLSTDGETYYYMLTPCKESYEEEVKKIEKPLDIPPLERKPGESIRIKY